jgi:hypothetical protein
VSELEILVLELVDPKPKAVVLELEAAVPGLEAAEVAAHCSYRDSDT